MTVTPFTIEVPQAELDDLRARLRATRWPDAAVTDWSQGIPPAALRRVVDYWAEEFDWRAVERRLNQLDHVMVDGIHAVRAGTPGATPLLLVHGWPDSVVRFLAALPLLEDRFELVIPSIPGYGFSAHPSEPLGPVGVADRFAALMTELGHERYAVHGGDIGTQIADQSGLRHPDRITALHLGDVPLRRMRGIAPADLTDAEREWQANGAAWELAEGGYSHVQRTKPQTLAAALNDSPAGLAAWILEKFEAWSDRGLDAFTLESLATNLTIYWVTQSAGSAARYYYDNTVTPTGLQTAPTGFALFPADICPAPEESAKRWYPVQRWTQLPRGGHFGPWEEPELWAAEVRAFADQVGI
ncbi:MAG: epoxide hydrolase [Actinobacteria bacterium]|nr:epoxide hydrolase [Actinomycetota bacterium]